MTLTKFHGVVVVGFLFLGLPAGQDKSGRTVETEKTTTPPAFAPGPSPTPKSSKAVDKEFSDSLKRMRANAEREEKERLKYPERIDIESPVDKVRGAIIQVITSAAWNYTLEDDSQNRLVFTREVKGARGAIVQAITGDVYRAPKHFMVFTISELKGTTTVSVNLGAVSGNYRTDMNKNKEWRRYIRGTLSQLKQDLEAGRAGNVQ